MLMTLPTRGRRPRRLNHDSAQRAFLEFYLCVASAILGAGSAAETATAQTTKDWIGGASDDWFEGANWNPNGSPTNITNTVNVDASVPNATRIAAPGAAAVAVRVGAAGSGDLSVTGGGTLDVVASYLGFGPGATGVAVVSDIGSAWSSSLIVDVAYEGVGTLSVLNGGTMSVTSGGSMYVGHQAGSTGAIAIDGEGSQLSVSNTLFLGFHGEGSIELRNGGVAASQIAFVGNGNSGVAVIDGVGSAWTNAADFQVGRFGAGELRLQNGGTLSSATGFVGTSLDANGTAIIDGAGSVWTNSGELRIAELGAGSISIQNGGRLAAGNAFVGNNIGSHGVATVTGPDSRWSNSGPLVVGRFGAGELFVNAGGVVTNTNGVLGNSVAAGSMGSATISGAESRWENSGELHVGRNTPGLLSVVDGGLVTSALGAIASQPGSSGTATVSGADSAWKIAEKLAIGGNAAVLAQGGTGLLDVQEGGLVSVAQDVLVFTGGTLKLNGGKLAVGAVQLLGGAFDWPSGVLHVGTFSGDLTNEGGVLAPGASPGSTNIQGNYAQQTGGALAIELGGATPGLEFDVVGVTGEAMLDGQLLLFALDGYFPPSDGVYSILSAADGIVGEFSNVAPGGRLLTADGLGSFQVDYGPASAFAANEVILSGFQFAADVDGNGVVDGGDLAAWEAGFGENDPALADGDMNGDQVVDGADFLVWQLQVGIEGEERAVGVVPEPSSCLLAAMACFVLVDLVRRGRKAVSALR